MNSGEHSSLENLLDQLAAIPDSDVPRYTVHLIPETTADGVPTGRLWPLKSGSAAYKRIMELSGGVLPKSVIKTT